MILWCLLRDEGPDYYEGSLLETSKSLCVLVSFIDEQCEAVIFVAMAFDHTFFISSAIGHLKRRSALEACFCAQNPKIGGSKAPAAITFWPSLE